jgi:hypothetical protein
MPTSPLTDSPRNEDNELSSDVKMTYIEQKNYIVIGSSLRVGAVA